MQEDKHFSSLFCLLFYKCIVYFIQFQNFRVSGISFISKRSYGVLFETVKNTYSKIVRGERGIERREKWVTDERLHIHVKN